MTITAIILAHFKERERNLKRIVDDLLGATTVPQEVIIFIDNPAITFTDERVTIIRSSRSFLPIIRFAIGSICDTDYCFFIDDDLTVGKKTLENFSNYANDDDPILGLEGSILGKTETPYSNDTPIRSPKEITEVDIIIRVYFVPTDVLTYPLEMQANYAYLPKKSLDDVYLCISNKIENVSKIYVIPTNDESGLIELPDGGVGQSLTEDHYKNRNIVCRKLMDVYV
jgi:hypothetical protein